MVDICHAAKSIPYRLQMLSIVRMYITHSLLIHLLKIFHWYDQRVDLLSKNITLTWHRSTWTNFLITQNSLDYEWKLPLINMNDSMCASLYILWFLYHPVVKLKCCSGNKHRQHLPCPRKYWNFSMFNINTLDFFEGRLLTSPWFQIISLCLHQSHVLFKQKIPGEFCQNSWKVMASRVHARC